MNTRAWCTRLRTWRHRANLHEAEAASSKFGEVVAIGVEARSEAYRVAKVNAKYLAS